MEYWSNNPPLHLMLKGYFGIKNKPKTTSVPDELEIQSIVNQFNGK